MLQFILLTFFGLKSYFTLSCLATPPFQPLSWQQPYVPVLSSGMLDFLMAPTAFLMGCHISHFEEVAAVSAAVQRLRAIVSRPSNTRSCKLFLRLDVS